MDGKTSGNVREAISKQNPYVNWKPIKRYGAGMKSAGVYQMPNNVVKKVYDRNDAKQVGRFHHEVAVMKQLKGCDFVPQLLYADEANTTLYMQDCGSTPAPTPQLRDEIDKLMHRLEDEYRVIRTENIGRKRYAYSRSMNNVTQKNGKTYIIDFGCKRWQILPPKSATGPIVAQTPSAPDKTLSATHAKRPGDNKSSSSPIADT